MSQQPNWALCPKATHYSPALEPDDIWCAVFWQLDGDKAVAAWPVQDDGSIALMISKPSMLDGTLLRMIERPAPEATCAPQWDGRDLPPVGTVCEYSLTNGGVWHECTVKYVLANGRQLVADCAGNPDGEAVLHVNTCIFRPARTPEQIIADREREERIKAAQVWLEGIAQEYGSEIADKCEDILMEAEGRKKVAP